MMCCVYAKQLQSCLTLWDLMDWSLPGSSVHGILQTRTLRWVAMPFSRGSYQLRIQARISYISCTVRWVLYQQCHLGSHRGIKWDCYRQSNNPLKSGSMILLWIIEVDCGRTYRANPLLSFGAGAGRGLDRGLGSDSTCRWSASFSPSGTESLLSQHLLNTLILLPVFFHSIIPSPPNI